jgi:hypothetical protein
MSMTRRRLLAAVAAVALLPSQAFASAADAAEGMLSLLPDRNAAAKLGETWVRQENPRPDAVMQSLQQRLNGGDAGKLRNAIAEDFRNGAVVKIEGWQIARTQAELCALAYFAIKGSF